MSGFYLGYLRGRDFPPKMSSFPSNNVVIITVYTEVTTSEKSSRRDEVSAHEVSIPCLRTLYDKEQQQQQFIQLSIELGLSYPQLAELF